MRLWIDTDVGDNPDDAIALACAAVHPDVEVVGVSVVGDRRDERARLARELVDAPVHDADGGALTRAFTRARPDALLAIGPLTNAARLLAEVVPERVVVMGGAVGEVRHRGAVRSVEHNLGVDPAAAAAVLAMSPVTLVPLDVTVAMRATARDVDRLIAARPCLDTETRRWLVGQEAAGVPSDERAVVLHDPLALLVCVRDDEAAVSIEARAITVEAGGALVLDEGRVHDVVRSVDASRAVERVLALLEA